MQHLHDKSYLRLALEYRTGQLYTVIVTYKRQKKCNYYLKKKKKMASRFSLTLSVLYYIVDKDSMIDSQQFSYNLIELIVF